MTTGQRTYYDVLGLIRSPDLSANELKQAYHRTLLLHHPDKSRERPQAAQSPSIDEITQAYTYLSNPATRESYDRELSKSRLLGDNGAVRASHAGIESFDLDDLKHSVSKDGTDMWSRECRCGNEIGYRLTDGDLESASAHLSSNDDQQVSEISVPCQGCSLKIRVTFIVT